MITHYGEYRDRMKTGDVMAFSGKGRVSGLIKAITNSDFSHVGLILRMKLEGGFGDTVFLAESTTLIDVPDAITGDVHKGVQIVWLSKRLASYSGKAYYCELKEPIPLPGLIQAQGWLRERHAKRTPYDSFQALGAGLDLFDSLGLRNDPDFSALFCSELVGRFMQLAGKIPLHENPSEMTPADIVRMAIFNSPKLLLED